MINFLKGVAGGIGNIVPGLSGSALLVILGIYDKCLDAISNLFKDFKNSFKFLFPIGCGILFGTFVFANIIEVSLNNFSLATSIIFVGFMIGTLPSLFKQAYKEKFKKRFLIPLVISFLLGVSLLFYKNNFSFDITDFNYLTLIGVGFLIAISTIIPGISSTVLLTMIGMYDVYIGAINTFNIEILFFIAIGVFIGFLILSKIISYLLNRYYSYTFYAIIGFVISTIPALLTEPLILNSELIIGIILSVIACFITVLFSKNCD